jgi:sugar lactone lactonase YvrE
MTRTEVCVRPFGGVPRHGVSRALSGLLVLAAVGAGTMVRAAPRDTRDIALPGEAAYPESITATADGALYVSNFAGGGVIRIEPGASSGEVWIAPGAFETRSTFGVLADEASGTLWVCSNDLSALGIQGPSDVKGAALKGFDLKTGAGKISASFPVSPAICNDIAIGPDGAAYVTNTLGPQILRLKPGAQTLEVWKSDPQLAPEGQESGLDGIAFGLDGNLYVDTFTKAKLFRIEVKDGQAGALTPLTPSRPLVLTDGLRPLGDGAFLLAEGGGRLDRMTVSGNTANVEVLRDGIAGGVTSAAKVGATAFITVGQLAFITEPARKGNKPELPFRVLAVPLTVR